MSERNHYDAVIVGRGVAGSAAAKSLSEAGTKIAIVEKKKFTPEKSLFVNGQHLPEGLFNYLKRRNSLIEVPDLEVINPDNPKLNWTKTYPNRQNGITYAVFHQPIIDYFNQNLSNDVDIFDQDLVTATTEDSSKVTIDTLSGKKITADFLIDASGDGSPISRKHRLDNGEIFLDDDPYVLWVKGYRITGEFKPGVLICPMGKNLGLSWILPYSKNSADIVAADYSKMHSLNVHFQEDMLDDLIKFCQSEGLCRITGLESRFDSFIRCQPIPYSSVEKTQRVYTLGAAAGMGSPLFAEVLPAALKWGQGITESFKKSESPRTFYKKWRFEQPLFPYTLEMNLLDCRLKDQAKGVYGKGLKSLQLLTDNLPENVQSDIFTYRSHLSRHWIPILRIIAKHPTHLPWFLKMSQAVVKSIITDAISYSQLSI